MKEEVQMIFRDLLEHLNRQKEIERQKETCRNVAIGAAFGTMVGLAVGILFAPRSGRETRQAIADKTVDTAGQVKETVAVYAGELKDKAHAARQVAREAVESAKGTVQGLAHRVQHGAENVEDTIDAAREDVADKLDEAAEKVKPY